VTVDVSTILEQGEAALTAGDWANAVDLFRAAIDTEPHPAAQFGLATALWWQGEIRESLRAWTAAYGGFRRAGAALEAALVAVSLSLFYDTNLGNRVVASGWLRRAARLAAELDDPVIDGWVAVNEAALTTDPERAVALADVGRAAGAEHGDHDLELCGLSAMGWALGAAGRSTEGVEPLDEAMAGAIGGEVENLDTIVFTSCLLMQSCVNCADFARMVHWMRAIEDFVATYGCPYLNATCRTHYGEILAATGDWSRADHELKQAMHLADHAMPAIRAIAAACLAELRLAQGRVAEARQLIAGFEDRAVSTSAVARLALVDGELDRATTVLVRRLDALGDEAVQSARLRELLGEIQLTRGDLPAAMDSARRLATTGRAVECPIIEHRAFRLLGRALTAEGEPDEARPLLESALAGFAELELPVEVARTRMALADLLDRRDRDLAIAEAKAAHSTFDELGAAPEADAAAGWLRARGVAVSRATDAGLATLTRRETEVLGLMSEGLSNPEIATRLYVSRRTVEHHVASVLSKLGLRNRTEAATFTTRAAVDGVATK
jgi:DNA-binding CsgD family transcriptional regulator